MASPSALSLLPAQSSQLGTRWVRLQTSYSCKVSRLEVCVYSIEYTELYKVRPGTRVRQRLDRLVSRHSSETGDSDMATSYRL